MNIRVNAGLMVVLGKFFLDIKKFIEFSRR